MNEIISLFGFVLLDLVLYCVCMEDKERKAASSGATNRLHASCSHMQSSSLTGKHTLKCKIGGVAL